MNVDASLECVCGHLGGVWAGENSGNFRAILLIKAIKPKSVVRPYRGCSLCSNGLR